MRLSSKQFISTIGAIIIASLAVNTACGGGGGGGGKGGKTLRRIEVTPVNTSLANGTNQQLVVNAIYSDNTMPEITAEVMWEVDNPDNAYVTATGEFRSIRKTDPQTVTVTATYLAKTAAATITITDKEVVSIEISPLTKTIPAGTDLQLRAIAIFTDKTTQDITTSAEWSDEALASFASVNNDANKGKVHGDAEGAEQITAVYGGKSAGAAITVSTATLSALIVSPVNKTIALGTKLKYTATAYFSDNTRMDVTSVATWTLPVDGTGGATVVEGNFATTIADPVCIAGTVSVKAEYTAGVLKAATTGLEVSNAALESIQITPDNPISYGTSQQFTATGYYTGGATQDITSAVEWSSGNAGIATISNAAGQNGLATSVGPGTTNITAVFGLVEATTSLEVKLTTLQSIAVVPAGTSENIGTVKQFRANGTYSDGTVQELTTQVIWRSGDNTIAQVSNAKGSKGVVTAIASGTAAISASRDYVQGSTGFAVNIPETAKPGVNPVAALLSGNRVLVRFSESMDIVTATEPANYIIAENVTGGCGDDTNFNAGDQTADFAISSVSAQSLTEFIIQLNAGTQAKTYKVVVSKALKDLAGNTLDCENLATFQGLDTVPPYLLGAINNTPQTLIVRFSEDMTQGGTTDSADNKDNYTLTKTSGNTDVPSISSVDKINDYTFQLNLDTSTYPIESVQYRIAVAPTVTDKAIPTANQLAEPLTLTFLGNEQLKVVLAEAESKTSVVLTFNKPVHALSAACATNSDCAKLYKILPSLGDITLATVHENRVTVTHQDEQDGGNYSIICANGLSGDQFDNAAGESIKFKTSTNPDPETFQNLQAAPRDRASFTGMGTPITTPGDGAQFEDPFGDLTATGFSFVYNGKVYVGPNAGNAALVRFDPNGRNLIQVNFDTRSWNGSTLQWDYYTPDANRYDFGHETADVNGGPDLVDGVGYFTAVTINSLQYLVAGVQEISGANPKLNQLFLSKQYGTTLEFFRCGLTAPANVSSTSAVYGYGGKLYVGMASSASAQKPGFNVIAVTDESYGESCGTALAFGKDLPGIKGSGTARTVIGIDVITSIHDGSNDYLVVANSNAFDIALIDTVNGYPDGAGDFTNVQTSLWNRSGTTNTRVYNKITTLQPWERGIPAVVQYDGTVYVARNRCTLASASDTALCSTALTPELWKGTYSGDPTVSANWIWTQVFDAASFNASIDAISLLMVSGGRLYIGMDSASQGAHLVYADLAAGSPGAAGDFTQLGRADNPACGFGDSKAFGKDCSAHRFFSGAHVEYSGSHYLYMSAGNGTGSLRVFKQVD